MQRIYEWILDQSITFGWFPGGLVENKASQHEIYKLNHIIEIGILLAENGYREYWDDIERFVRNHFMETQLSSCD